MTEGPTRFKSRFSLLSLLPARHPPLQPDAPPVPALPAKQRFPPTQQVQARHPTVISLDSDLHSPVHSVCPSSLYSPPILPPAPAFSSPSRAGSSRSPLSTASSYGSKTSKSSHRPPPLDLRRTKEVYPGVPGVVPTAGLVASPGTEVQPFQIPARDQKRANLAKAGEAESKGQQTEYKPKRRLFAIADDSDQFDLAEVEPGHRYASWLGGTQVSIKPGQSLPDFGHPEPVVRGIDPPARTSSRAATGDRRDHSRNLATPIHESVLHDVLLTPTYLRRSPSIPLTPSPLSPRGDWPSRSGRRKTLLDALKRGSRMMSKRNEGLGSNRSGRGMREREAAEADRFRMATRHVRLADDDDSRAYSTHTPKVHAWYPGTDLYARKSPATREWGVGLPWSSAQGGEKKGDAARLWRKKKEEEEKRKKRRMWKLLALVLLICLAVLAIGLCTSLLTKKSGTSASSSSATSSISDAGQATLASVQGPASAYPTPSSAPSRTLSTCLELFATSAPTSPLSYPCSDCVPLLSSADNDYFNPLSNGNSTGVGAALQFCAVNDIFRATEGNGLHEDGWMKDGSPCTWSGIKCDDRGRVTQLELKYPDIPSTLSPSLCNLVGLQTLRLMGNSTVPSGDLPASLFTLANLTTLDIEYTALSGSIAKMDLSKASQLDSLVLVNNAQLGTTLPQLTGNTGLRTLAVTGQGLSSVTEQDLPSSLTYLDLSYNALAGSVPAFASLSALQTLYLSNNKFSTAPASLPGSLTSLSFTTNPDLSGPMPLAVCASMTLTSCDLRSTKLGGSDVVAGAFGTSTTGIQPSSTAAAAISVGTGRVCGSCQYN